MNLLALETSDQGASIALQLASETQTQRIESTREQSLKLMPTIDGMLQDAGIKLADLDAIGFGRGPGSFTGVRLASSLVQGLASAAGLKIAPVSSLAVAALGLGRRSGASKIVVSLDARMGEVYYAEFILEGGIAIPISDEQLAHPGTIQVPRGETWAYGGSGFSTYPELSKQAGSAAWVESELTPQADDLLPFIASALGSDSLIAPENCVIEYLRLQSAWHSSA